MAKTTTHIAAIRRSLQTVMHLMSMGHEPTDCITWASGTTAQAKALVMGRMTWPAPEKKEHIR